MLHPYAMLNEEKKMLPFLGVVSGVSVLVFAGAVLERVSPAWYERIVSPAVGYVADLVETSGTTKDSDS